MASNHHQKKKKMLLRIENTKIKKKKCCRRALERAPEVQPDNIQWLLLISLGISLASLTSAFYMFVFIWRITSYMDLSETLGTAKGVIR